MQNTTIKSGAKIYNSIIAEDVCILENAVVGENKPGKNKISVIGRGEIVGKKLIGGKL